MDKGDLGLGQRWTACFPLSPSPSLDSPRPTPLLCAALCDAARPARPCTPFARDSDAVEATRTHPGERHHTSRGSAASCAINAVQLVAFAPFTARLWATHLAPLNRSVLINSTDTNPPINRSFLPDPSAPEDALYVPPLSSPRLRFLCPLRTLPSAPAP